MTSNRPSSLKNFKAVAQFGQACSSSKKKSVFYKSRWFYIAWAACFLVFFLAGVSYYMVFVDNVEEYPVGVRQSPGYEVIDSVAKKTDSLIISPDSILENNFE